MGGGRRSTTSSSSSSSSGPLPPDLAEYVAVSSGSGSDSDGCVCDDPELEALLDAGHFCVNPTPPPQRQNRSLREAKDLIRRYKPGDWIGAVGGTKAEDYVLPETTTLLLVGPRGAGKSTLVNRITRVFDKDDDPFAPERAQVSYNLTSTGGSCFLREYAVPRNSNAICVYDTRSLSIISGNNFMMLQRWMTKGVNNGEMVIWDTDDAVMMKNFKSMGRQGSFLPCKTRTVNFVIFVVDGISVLKSMDGKDKRYIDVLHDTFNYPFLSFRDDKPVVVVTHGDRLALQQRAHIQTELGELLGIPLGQIFDIPGFDDYETDLAILDMLRYCIEHAEQNFPVKLNHLIEMHGRETYAKIVDRLMSLDAVIEAVIIFLCIIILLLRISDKLLPW